MLRNFYFKEWVHFKEPFLPVIVCLDVTNPHQCLEEERQLDPGMGWLHTFVKEDRVISGWNSIQNSCSCAQCFDRRSAGMLISDGFGMHSL